MYRDSTLGLLIKLDPKAAAVKIGEAFAKYDHEEPGRTIELVAKILDVSATSLKRHLANLEAQGIAVTRVAKAEPAPKARAKKPAKRKKKAA